MICQRLGLSVHDVLDAARTKWNFLDFQPGLVGGHCIGVDPFYLAHKAAEVGHHPQIILAGRSVNDGMPAFIADCLAERLPHGREDPGARPDLQGERAGSAQLQGGRTDPGARRPGLRARGPRSRWPTRPRRWRSTACGCSSACRPKPAYDAVLGARAAPRLRRASTARRSPACCARAACSPTSRASGAISSCRPECERWTL